MLERNIGLKPLKKSKSYKKYERQLEKELEESLKKDD